MPMVVLVYFDKDTLCCWMSGLQNKMGRKIAEKEDPIKLYGWQTDENKLCMGLCSHFLTSTMAGPDESKATDGYGSGEGCD